MPSSTALSCPLLPDILMGKSVRLLCAQVQLSEELWFWGVLHKEHQEEGQASHY